MEEEAKEALLYGAPEARTCPISKERCTGEAVAKLGERGHRLEEGLGTG